MHQTGNLFKCKPTCPSTDTVVRAKNSELNLHVLSFVIALLKVKSRFKIAFAHYSFTIGKHQCSQSSFLLVLKLTFLSKIVKTNQEFKISLFSLSTEKIT